ncbi:hypothetical protein [Pontibacter chitinilyticus]|uniref:hypothetical protein n=1 Tax=Pontibacter chitinilyticus TaxID=2674989 RepID=UPI0032197A2C
MKRLFIVLALPCALLASCNKGPTVQEQKAALQDQVMATHDEAMNKMGDIYHLRRDIRSLRDSLVAQQTDTTRLQLLQLHLQLLGKADEAMMNWMHQYHAPDSLANEQAIDYLKQEQEKINKVNAKMDSTIAAARQTYNTYEQKK